MGSVSPAPAAPTPAGHIEATLAPQTTKTCIFRSKRIFKNQEQDYSKKC